LEGGEVSLLVAGREGVGYGWGRGVSRELCDDDDDDGEYFKYVLISLQHTKLQL
jgi:hypothetical protein